MFRVVKTIYGVDSARRAAPLYHADVRFFEITDAAGGRVGQFYLDLHAREGKRGRRVDGRRR
jgi:oligopeptidase A